MRVLVACEFSGIVRDAFIARGHDAVSCDLLETERPGPHIQGDVIQHLDSSWDLMIAHPPCTYLCTMSNCRIKEPGRVEKRERAMAFLMCLAKANIPRIAIENPKGYPERAWRKADQIIEPFEFGYPASKKTCLWLKNLPPLMSTQIVKPEKRWDGRRWRQWVDFGEHGWGARKSHNTSRTFQGIADAMADQWGRARETEEGRS